MMTMKFSSIDRRDMARVTGGTARVASTSSSSDLAAQLQAMTSSIGDSIKDLANNQNNSSNSMLPMIMMMAMGGMGGGGGASAAAAAPPPAPPPQGTFVKVNVR